MTLAPSAKTSSQPATVSDANQAARLTAEACRLHGWLIDAVLETGVVPPMHVLADRLQLSEDTIHDGLRALAAADYLAVDEGNQVACLYPFSTTPTAHLVVIDGRPRFAICGIDALGIPAMRGREPDITGRCAVCNQPIALRVGPGVVIAAEPTTAMVVARRDEAEPAFAAWCPFTVFVCDQHHADEFVRRFAGEHALPLAEALTRAEMIFADLLAEQLPARRPRGKRWKAPDHA